MGTGVNAEYLNGKVVLGNFGDSQINSVAFAH